ESISGYEALLEQQSKAEHWKRYLDCDGLPRVASPPEIRTFLEQVRHECQVDVNHTVNWELAVNERSVITQDIFATEETRQELVKERPNLGQLYSDFVQRILIVLHRIDLLFASQLEMQDMPLEHATEITATRSELNQEIDVLFDKLSYRIISEPNAFSTSDDGFMQKYCYQSSKFNFQLWWLRDVPIRFKYLELPVMLAQLDCVGVTVQIPYSVLSDNLTLRCVHTFFDPYSEFAKSYEQVVHESDEDLNAGIADIEDCLINEWLMQVRIMNNIMDEMDERIQRYLETEKRLAKPAANKPAPSDKKTAKPPKEPQTLPPGMYPDPYNIFLEREQRDYYEFLDQNFHPRNLQLEANEVNLREYNILGGIFSLVFMRKPKHTDFEKFNMTLHADGRVLYTMQHVLELETRQSEWSRKSEFSRKSGLQKQQSSMHVGALQADMAADGGVLHLQDKELPYFYVTIQLPAHLCLWGEPLPCQFIEEEEEEKQPDEESLEEENVGKRRKTRKTRKTRHGLGVGVGVGVGVGSDEEGSTERPYNRRTLAATPQTLIKRKRHNSKNIYRPSLLAMLRRTIPRSIAVPGVSVHDFFLAMKCLNKCQMHALQDHCLPRVLSSFKFPAEFRMEKFDEKVAEKAKANKLMRRHRTTARESEEDEINYCYSHEDQQAPERMYPIFPERDKIIYDDDYEQQASSDAPSVTKIKIDLLEVEAAEPTVCDRPTFYGVLRTLEGIQEQYRVATNAILSQSDGKKPKKRKEPQRSSDQSGAASVQSGRKTTVRISITRAMSLISDQSDAISTNSVESVRVGTEVPSVSGSYADVDETPASELQAARPKVKHWTNKYILSTDFNKETYTYTIKTDRLGLFGFAYQRYGHFPFRDWCLQPNDDNPNELIFTLDTYYVRVVLFISSEGIRGYVTDITNEYVAHPVKYLEIVEPISDYRELRKRFCERNINIFAEHDACFYIHNGYFCEKHLATELHVYDAIAVHCKLIKFYRCDWNRLATRRNLLLGLRNPKDINDAAAVTVRVTPDASTFVEVTELCSDNLDIFNLHYQLTWRNIGIYSDVHQLINSMYPQATDVRNRDPKLIHSIRQLFNEVRPLSFS
ncbi:CG12983, partial [Drosophila busckii]